MNDEMLIEFDGSIRNRNEFLDQITEPVDRITDGRIHANGMPMFFREIIKNIYDHTDGRGRVRLAKTDQGIDFKIEDYGNESHSMAELKSKPSSKAGNGINYGVGLELIEGMASSLEIIDFKIDCSKGFTYSGIYPYETRT